jgi:molybdopterin-guanine dinucleotide biosynthesis protein B
MIPILTVIGKTGCGKTTIIEKLIPEFRNQGFKIATIKHHSHRGFDIDQPGKDSWRFAQAGSDQVIIASPDKIATYRNIEQELSLDEILFSIRSVDIVLAEGYAKANKPAIEIIRKEKSLELIGSIEQRIALVSDSTLDLKVPLFGLEEISDLAGFILNYFGLRKRT